jgi:hypothetical protein
MTDGTAKWLDPDDGVTAIPASAAISLDEIEPITAKLLGDVLVAQRLISVGALELADESAQTSRPAMGWGHTLASLVAVLLSGSLATNTPQARRTIRRFQEQLLRAQSTWPDLASTSDKAFLVCADHLPAEFGLPEHLYPSQDPDALLSQSGFGPLIDKLINVVSPVPGPAWMSSRAGLREALTTILAETFKNTHDHARRDIDQSDIAPSVRGIFARYASLQQIGVLVSSAKPETLTPAQRYASHFIPRKAPKGARLPDVPRVDGVLELSVFDSGPGMAAKWLRRSVIGVPIQEQLDAVMACFAKGQTSTDTHGRGYGLAKVLLRLRSLHGFIGVRTNQIHVYRQFGSMPGLAHHELSDGTRVPKEVLFDWKKHFAQTATQLTPVNGTVVTFLLPMGGQ